MAIESSTISKDELNKLYWQEGLSEQKIANQIGCSKHTVHKRLQSYSIPRRPVRGIIMKALDLTPERLRYHYWEEGLNLRQIASKYGLSLFGVQHRMKINDIPFKHYSGSELHHRALKARWARNLASFNEIANIKQPDFSLRPDYIVGITDGEGCFYVSLHFGKNPPLAQCGFSIDNYCDGILDQVKAFFGFGSVTRKGSHCATYAVHRVPSCIKIAKFFREHPLKVKTHAFRCWVAALRLVASGEYRTDKGLRQLILLQQTMNIKHSYGRYKP